MNKLIWTLMSLMLAVGAQANAADKPPRRPRIEPGMPVPDMMVVRAAFKSAAKSLVKKASCQSLFQDLKLNGLQALGHVRYQQAQTARELALCGGNVAAATGVGLSQVLICRRFHTLPPHQRTVVLIHEALHTAGLDEVPYDPNGLTSRQITEMVEQACSN
jgi:hypothetical protein